MIYKKLNGNELSEIGIGTYLGNPDEETDKGYFETIKKGLELGINVVDTAINYRNMRSERVIGKVIQEVGRDKIFVSTKGGYLPTDDNFKDDPNKWFKKELIETGIVDIKDMTPYGNVLTPKYIDWSFNKSLENLKTDFIDVYFLHNVEDQLTVCSRNEFYDKLRAVFRLLEGKVKEGQLRYYGLATWNGFRVPPEHEQYLNLVDILNIAKDVGGENHHFKVIQLPYNIGMLEAYTLKNQKLNGENLSTLEASKQLGIYTYISATLFQGRVLKPVAPQVKQIFKVNEDNLVPIQFVRSTPGVGTALIGMSKIEHLEQNLKIEEYPPLTEEEFNSLFEKKKS
jgi:aryl-alcohol dehydrogenase-like predicted oxidoreductase